MKTPRTWFAVVVAVCLFLANGSSAVENAKDSGGPFKDLSGCWIRTSLCDEHGCTNAADRAVFRHGFDGPDTPAIDMRLGFDEETKQWKFVPPAVACHGERVMIRLIETVRNQLDHRRKDNHHAEE